MIKAEEAGHGCTKSVSQFQEYLSEFVEPASLVSHKSLTSSISTRGSPYNGDKDCLVSKLNYVAQLSKANWEEGVI